MLIESVYWMSDSVFSAWICTDISNQEVVINPVRQRLVQKMELYEEGRILTSDLLSSGDSLMKKWSQNCFLKISGDFIFWRQIGQISALLKTIGNFCRFVALHKL